MPKKSAVLRRARIRYPRRNHPHMAESSYKAGTLDISGVPYSESAMSLAEELAMLRKRVKDQDKEIRRLKK